jgi:pimeloyl-ACP methyl ester carboxylesterase
VSSRNDVRPAKDRTDLPLAGDGVVDPPIIPTQTHDVVQLPSGRIAFTTAGSGEPLLFVHGLGGTRETWADLLTALSFTHTVIAVDLPGHGQSDAPAGDYSLGAHATVLRDVLVALGHRSATVIGHSLGGGIALQFAAQFPERTRRLVLISSGGLGPELTVLLRAATLPGASAVVAGLARLPQPLTRRALSVMSAVPGVVARQDAAPLAQDLQGLADAGQRQAFISTAHTVIDWRGQSVSADRQLGLLADMPVLALWGGEDQTIPAHHHRAIAAQLPAARCVEITGAGHYPHETQPAQLITHLDDFLETTAPFEYSETRWRDLLGAGPAPGPAGADEAGEPEEARMDG